MFEDSPLKKIEMINHRSSLFEIKNFHMFKELTHLTISFLELDFFNQYIEDQDEMMEERHVRKNRKLLDINKYLEECAEESNLPPPTLKVIQN